MTKAEERANEKYPLMQEDDKEGLEALKYIGMECDSVSEYNSVRCSQQAYFIEGYLKAEKDTIEKAAKWLKNNLEGVVGGSIYIDDFLKAMRDE